MSFRLHARMGLFQLRTKAFVDKPNDVVDPSSIFGAEFPPDTPIMATVQWSADPALGFPTAPYKVRLAQEPLSLASSGRRLESLNLQSGAGYFQSLVFYGSGPTGVLCLTARLNAPVAGTEIWATDMLGDEIPNSRQSAIAPDGAAFLGPDIFGLRATGAVTLTDIAIFSLAHNADLPMRMMAEVGPPFEQALNYRAQSYLGQQLPPRHALAIRLQADALARANTPPPQAARLDQEIHRRNPAQFMAYLLQQRLFRVAEQNLSQLIGSGNWPYSERLSDNSGTIEIYPARLWQYLALTGPIESTVFGQSVSIPIHGSYPELNSGRDVFEAVGQSEHLPFPLITVLASHASGAPNAGAVTHEKPAQLCLPAISRKSLVRATEARPPSRRDAPAKADIELRFQRSFYSLTHFLELQRPAGSYFENDEIDAPKAFFANENPGDQSSDGAPKVVIGPVDLPLQGPDELDLADYGRDVFGRWPAPVTNNCPLPAWPVAAPSLISADVSYDVDGSASLKVTFSWDWTIRSPYEIRFGLLIAASGDAALQSLQPGDGLNRPGLAQLPLWVRFGADDAPLLQSNGPVPGDIKIEAIPAPQGAGPNDVRSYLLILPLGNVSTVFVNGGDHSLALCADAWEAVSGHTEQRRSKVVALFRDLKDPRPPILNGDRWKLLWTSRINGAGLARVRIPRPQVVSGDVGGFNVWRANEASVLDLAISEEYGSDAAGEDVLSAIREERDMSVRLVEIQSLVERHLWKPAFLRSFVNLFEAADAKLQVEDYDLVLPGAQAGLEFVMFSAMSRANVASDKTPLSNLAAIAVPVERPPERPALRVISSDVAGTFAMSGVCIALVGTVEGYATEDVRIFWSARTDVEDPSQLLQRLEPIANLTRQAARKYVPEVDELCDRMAMPVVHIFLMKPPQTWRRQSWAAELLKANGAIPAQQMASPRTPLLRLLIPPFHGPELRVEQRRPVAGGQTWVTMASGIFEVSPAPFAPCEIFLDLLDSSQNAIGVGLSKRFGEFVQTGLETTVGGTKLAARYDKMADRIVVSLTGDGSITRGRIVVSDPAGRIVKLDLS